MTGLIERVESIIASRPDLDPSLGTLTRRLTSDYALIDESHVSPEETAIFITCQTNDNKDRTYAAAAALARRMPEVPVFIDDMPAMGNWHDGYEAVRRELVAVLPNPLRPVKFPTGQYNTYTEALGLVEAAIMAEKRKNLVVVSPPMHQIRTFVTHVSVLQNVHQTFEPITNIFNLPCADYSDAEWEQVVRHSQGQDGKTRMQWLETELSKVAGKDKYANTNEPSRILSYMDARDARMAKGSERPPVRSSQQA